MASADATLSPRSPIVMSAALCQAREDVKRQLKARGERVSQYPARELTFLAGRFLAQNWQELIEEAQEWIMSSPSLRAMYERDLAQRAKRASQKSKQMNKTRTTEMRGCSQCETYERNGGRI